MATKTAKGLGLCCPMCGASEGPNLGLDLNSLDEITCNECSGVFSVEEAIAEMEEKLTAWRKVARLVEMAKGLAND